MAVPLLVLPAAVLLLESLVARPLYVDRYVLPGEAGAALLAGAGMYRIGQWLGDRSGRRALVWVPAVAVCLCTLLAQLGPQQRIRTPDSRLFDFGGPARQESMVLERYFSLIREQRFRGIVVTLWLRSGSEEQCGFSTSWRGKSAPLSNRPVPRVRNSVFRETLIRPAAE